MTRLIDADALIENHFSPSHRIALSYADKQWMRKIINEAPTVEAIPVDFIKDLHKEAIAYRDRLNPVWQNRSWNRADEQAIGINSVLQVWDDRHG